MNSSVPQSASSSAPQSVERYLQFLQLTPEALNRVAATAPRLFASCTTVAKKQYDAIEQIEALQAILEKHSSREVLEKTFASYFQQLPRAHENWESFLEQRVNTGKMHARIGLTPDWFLGSYARYFEEVVPFLCRKIRNRGKLSSILVTLNKLVLLDTQLILMQYQDDDSLEKQVRTLSQAEEMLLDSPHVLAIRDALGRLKHQVGVVKAEAEQIRDVAKENADQTVLVAEQAEASMHVLDQNREALTSLSRLVEQGNRATERIDEEFQRILQSVEAVQALSQEIREISNQTKMLSLNASIEAARAGEQGAGFRVVAQEVRTLSDRSRSSAEKIEALLKELRERSQAAQETLENSKRLAVQQTEAAHSVERASQSLTEKMSQTMDNASTIAANTQEQAAASESVEQSVAAITEEAQELEQKVWLMGNDFFHLSQGMETMRQTALQNRTLSNRLILRVVQTDHKLWRWNLYNLYLGYHHMDPKTLVDSHSCRLGKWYDAKKNDPWFRENEAFVSLESIHEKLHEQARILYETIQSKASESAIAQLDGLQQTSERIVAMLQSIEAVVP